MLTRTPNAPTRSSPSFLEQINIDLLPLKAGATFSLALAKTLNPDANAANGKGGQTTTGAGGVGGSAPSANAAADDAPWRGGVQGTLADEYDYVMHGKVTLSHPLCGDLGRGLGLEWWRGGAHTQTSARAAGVQV